MKSSRAVYLICVLGVISSLVLFYLPSNYFGSSAFVSFLGKSIGFGLYTYVCFFLVLRF